MWKCNELEIIVEGYLMCGNWSCFFLIICYVDLGMFCLLFVYYRNDKIFLRINNVLLKGKKKFFLYLDWNCGSKKLVLSII